MEEATKTKKFSYGILGILGGVFGTVSTLIDGAFWGYMITFGGIVIWGIAACLMGIFEEKVSLREEKIFFLCSSVLYLVWAVVCFLDPTSHFGVFNYHLGLMWGIFSLVVFTRTIQLFQKDKEEC